MSIGFTLPLRRADGGYFEMSNDLMTQIKSNFINLVSTMKGERPGNLTFGCDIHQIIFNSNDDDFILNFKIHPNFLFLMLLNFIKFYLLFLLLILLNFFSS